jgi:transporter family protein
MKILQGWQLFALGAAFSAGLTALFGKLGVAEINSNLATFIRTVVILLLTAGIVTLRGQWERPQSLSVSGVVFLVLSAIATGLSWLCYYHALQLGPVSKVAPIDKLSVAFAIVLGLLVLGEHLTWQVAVGGLMIIGGSLVILSS